ncbi:hypothetical protein [Rhodohalobacter sulfatireducens]|uniref:Uncharacterized protein n=1 Tax=Rhodohalobacter sulfatireducens TaxID=2911366 RepID=A0ABS9KE66_9BACT|nr:hypothetical protein [Rhodohalobacter sulfatireducens]MCG2589149.1 hypothetical protein [Rhodohalobacter sulfatireducens]
MYEKKYDLEDRLIDFGVRMIEISETVDQKRRAGRYLSGQLIRSGTSPGIPQSDPFGALWRSTGCRVKKRLYSQDESHSQRIERDQR